MTLLIILSLSFLIIAVLFAVYFHISLKKEKKKNNHNNKDIKYNKLVELLPQMVFETDEGGYFRFINDFGFDFIAYSTQSINNGLSLFDIVVEEEHGRLKDMMLYTKTGGLNRGQDFTLKSGNGVYLPVNLYLSSEINENGEIEFRGLIIDVEAKKSWQNKVLSAILETEDKERKRFSEDLHDGLGPLLSTIKLYVGRASKSCSGSSETKKLLNFSLELIEEAITSAKQISNNILPSAIEDNGLVPAIEDFFARLRRISNINIIFRPKISNEIPKSIEKALYRIVYELVNNTIKHSEASLINLDLLCDEYKFYLKYLDDGKGFDPETINHGLGLKNIDNRAKSIGAIYSFKTQPKQGLIYELKIDF